MTKDTRRRPKHYDRPGYRPGPEGQGSYVDQKGAADAREQMAWRCTTCYSPMACGAFGYCRERNLAARGQPSSG